MILSLNDKVAFMNVNIMYIMSIYVYKYVFMSGKAGTFHSAKE